MKKTTYGLLALVLAILFSCADDKTGTGKEKNGMVDFTIKASIPQGIKTYASSDKGGASNVKDKDLRFIMEAWTKDTPAKLAYRTHRIVSDPSEFTQPVTFTAQLLAQEYNFVFWADFVPKGTTADYYYKTSANTGGEQDDVEGFKDIDPTKSTYAADLADAANAIGNGLTDIKMLKLDDVSDDAKDAYFANSGFLDISTDQTPQSVTLYRPFGKYRLIATDLPEGYLAPDLSNLSVTVDYRAMSTPQFYTEFDASTGNVIGNPTTVSAACTPANSTVDALTTVGTGPQAQTLTNACVLAFDYIFAPEDLSSFPVAFNVAVASGNINDKREIPTIPIVRNKLTTVMGNFFSENPTFTTTVSDPFDGAEAIVNNSDTQPVPDLTKTTFYIPDYTVTPTYTFDFTGVDLSSLSAGTTITITDESFGDAVKDYKGDVYLKFASTPPANINWDFEVNDAAVYLNGVQMNTLTASVSTHTLHLDADCRIVTLNLTNGNVEIGSVATGTSAVVTAFNITPGCKVFWGVKSYAEISTAMSKATPNDGLFLMADIKNFTGSISLKNGYTFDGKGHILSGNTGSAKGILTWNGSTVNNVTIKNIEIDNTEPTTTGTHVINIVNSYGNAIENIKLVGSGKMASSGLVINSSSVIATGTIAISGYGLGGYGVDVSKGSTTSYPNTPYFDFSQTTLVGTKFTVLNSTNATMVNRPSWF